MKTIAGVLAVALLVGLSQSAAADEEQTTASTAVYKKTLEPVAARTVAWPGTYGWRYQPYYTYYQTPWYTWGSYYAYPPGAYTEYYYNRYYYPRVYHGGYGYTYYGPITDYGYFGY